MVKKQHGGNEEESFFSKLFENHNEKQSDDHSKSSGLLSGLFGQNSQTNQQSSYQTTSHDNTPTSSSGFTFQKIVSYIAAIILAGTLTVIGFTIYHSKSTTKYPPEISECPDYWDSIGPNKCRNTLNVGKCPDDDVVDFNQPKYSGPTGLTEKCKWASNCGLVWDGLKC